VDYVGLLATANPLAWLLVIPAVFVGAGLGFGVQWFLSTHKRQAAEAQAGRLVAEASQQAEALRKSAELEAKSEFYKQKEIFDKETAEHRTELRDLEKRISKREDNVERKLETLNTKERSLEGQQQKIVDRERVLGIKERQVEETLLREQQELLKLAGLSMEEAKGLLLSKLERELDHEASALIRRIIETAKDEAEQKAKMILTTCIQRFAADHTSDSTVSAIDIPSDEMKGRVIGREGRNIRAFEKATGIDVIVDDTPGVVVVSGFDSVRREVARRAMEKLIADGRIHPTRIEEVVTETQKEVERQINEVGKQTVLDIGVHSVHPKLVHNLGRLQFRTSYGQNVLKHVSEVSHLSGLLAGELGLDEQLARRCGLLHDIGKALDHDQGVEGGHPAAGADFLRRFNEPVEVLDAAKNHHLDEEPKTVYTYIVAAADAISASRPGARRETLERYIRRLEKLEEVACGFAGIEQAYAIQAGREIRVIADAEKVDDAAAHKIARDIAEKIQAELTYPGEVKVTLLRELRCVEYAR
jgi:ribonuclease Y